MNIINVCVFYYVLRRKALSDVFPVTSCLNQGHLNICTGNKFVINHCKFAINSWINVLDVFS